MRSSISNSRVPTKAHVVLLLGICFVVCFSVEVVTAYFFPRISKMEGRHEAEYRAMLAIHSERVQGRLSMLVAGNSLLLHGVDTERLQQELGPDIDLHRAAIENTFYWDWYYGLQGAFRNGARPDVVVLVLNPPQLVSNAIDGDYSVHLMVDGRDIPKLGKHIGADRNRLSAFALDKVSFFYGVRAEVRGLILDRFFPDFPNLTHFFHGPQANLKLRVDRQAAERLTRLRALCKTYGAAFLLVIPPAEQDGGANQILRIAESQGVAALMPIAPGVLARSDYSDDFHLNPSGAAKFTPAFAADLKQVIEYRPGKHGIPAPRTAFVAADRLGSLPKSAPESAP